MMRAAARATKRVAHMTGGGGSGLEGLVHFGGAGPEGRVLELGVQVPVQQDAQHAVGGGPGHHKAAELGVVSRLVPQGLCNTVTDARIVPALRGQVCPVFLSCTAC